MGLIGGSHDKIKGGGDGRKLDKKRLDLNANRIDFAALQQTMTPEERARLNLQPDEQVRREDAATDPPATDAPADASGS